MQILSGELKFNSPVLKLKDRRQEVDNLIRDIISEMDKKLNNEHKKLMNLKHDLSILNPSIGLDNGYGIILDEKGHLIRSIEGVSLKDNIQIMMKDGKINTKVWEIHKEVCNED
jgi:exodeoxyribonuclease VII large subunit